jgi:hypothetical protein
MVLAMVLFCVAAMRLLWPLVLRMIAESIPPIAAGVAGYLWMKVAGVSTPLSLLAALVFFVIIHEFCVNCVRNTWPQVSNTTG